MLDGNFNPRLGDFGLARIMEHDKSPVSTLTAGTMGFLAPEYLQYGRQPIERENGDQKTINLVDYVWGLHSEGRLIEAADPRMKGEFDEEEMRKLLLVGLSCSNPDCSERPNVRRVLQIPNNEAQSILVPKSKPRVFDESSSKYRGYCF